MLSCTRGRRSVLSKRRVFFLGLLRYRCSPPHYRKISSLGRRRVDWAAAHGGGVARRWWCRVVVESGTIKSYFFEYLIVGVILGIQVLGGQAASCCSGDGRRRRSSLSHTVSPSVACLRAARFYWSCLRDCIRPPLPVTMVSRKRTRLAATRSDEESNNPLGMCLPMSRSPDCEQTLAAPALVMRFACLFLPIRIDI